MSAYGRWMYGPWFWPPAADTVYGPINNPYYNMDPNANPPFSQPLAVPCNMNDPTTWQYQTDPFCEPEQIPFVGMEPAVKPAVEKVNGRRVLVLATNTTVREEKLHNLVVRLESEDIVDLHALPGLVEFAENFIFDDKTVIPYLLDEFSEYDLKDFGAVVLGCTHFVFFKERFKEILPPGVEIVDGNIGTINRLKSMLEGSGLNVGEGKGDIIFYSSGEKATDEKRYRRYLELEY
jgi:glutamate racemase